MGFDIKDFKNPIDLTQGLQNYIEVDGYFYLGKITDFEVITLKDKIKIRGDISLTKHHRKEDVVRGLSTMTFHIFDNGLPYYSFNSFDPITWTVEYEKHDFFQNGAYNLDYREIILQKVCNDKNVAITDGLLNDVFSPLDQRVVNIYDGLKISQN